MSSVTRFLRQRTPGLHFYSCPSGTTFYTFTPGSGNSPTANYPNNVGYMSSATIVLNDASGDQSDSTNFILRDMGKTVSAVLGTTLTGPQYYWREYQIINLKLVAGIQGNPTTVGGASDPAGYYTVYLPTIIGGQIATAITAGAINPPNYPTLMPLAGSQM